MRWKSYCGLLVIALLLAVSCKPLKKVYRRTTHWQKTKVETRYLHRAEVVGGTELDTGRFEVLHYAYSSYRPGINHTWYGKEVFVRLTQLENLPAGQPVSVPSVDFALIGYGRATNYFEQFKNISGTLTRLNNSATQPRLRFDLRYIDRKKLPRTLLRGTFTFRLDSTYFQRTSKDYKGEYDDLRLALKEPAKVKSLDLATYAIQYEERNGRDSGPDTLYARLGELYNLEELNLHLSDLATLPQGLTNLKRLKKLDLGYNNLTQFPTELYQLDSLRELNLEYNQLDSLPAAIRQMTSLRILNLNDNRLLHFPTAVTTLVNLRELYLGNANLQTLPASIGQLQKLEVLELKSFWNNKRKNQITNVDALVALPRLRRLSLKDNPLDSLPTAVYRLRQLEELNVQYTGLDTVDLRRLPNLKKLEFRYLPYFPKPTQP